MNPKELARLLEPFGIHPHNHRTSPGKVIKGYSLEHFVKSWNQHLPPRSDVAADLQNPSQPIRNGVAANSQNPSTDISGQRLPASSPQLIGSDVAAHSLNCKQSQASAALQPGLRYSAPVGAGTL